MVQHDTTVVSRRLSVLSSKGTMILRRDLSHELVGDIESQVSIAQL